MNLERYSRQIVLKEFGIEGQQKLVSSKILVVGAGGLGVPVLTYLNAMGVGTLGIVDADTVSITNLHRQVLFNEDEIGEPKAIIAKKKLKAQNPDTQIRVHSTFLGRENALEIIGAYDLIIDATDNFPSRYLINDACIILKKPFVYGALHGFEGQVSVFNYKGGPTYRCLFPNMPKADEVPNCNEHGVLGILPGIVGNLQALEAIKVITGIGEVLAGTLLLFNGLNQSYQKIKFQLNSLNSKINVLEDTYDFKCEIMDASIGPKYFEELHANNDIQVIDVRSIAEYESSHLDNALNYPLDQVENWKEILDYSLSTYLLCQSGVRSLKALSILKDFKPEAAIFNVKGGINQMNSHAFKY